MQYRRQLLARQSLGQQRAYALQQQNRMAQYSYQQMYFQRLRQQQARLAAQRYNYANDPYFYTPASYRYGYGGNYYQTNHYGADLLRQAINYGYQEGIRAGRADREDRWASDYRNSYAYQDANYGYNGYYVSQADYNYYFRQGFRRGYEDGFGRQYQYGQYQNGSNSILSTVLALILNLQPLG
ncbi:MAG TPA: hypothetical protein VHF02_06685 [Luteimonas sp.]|nr:hypothetical protein [Luteimonas sp.]